jgi:hypothetical protein
MESRDFILTPTYNDQEAVSIQASTTQLYRANTNTDGTYTINTQPRNIDSSNFTHLKFGEALFRIISIEGFNITAEYIPQVIWYTMSKRTDGTFDIYKPVNITISNPSTLTFGNLIDLSPVSCDSKITSGSFDFNENGNAIDFNLQFDICPSHGDVSLLIEIGTPDTDSFKGENVSGITTGAFTRSVQYDGSSYPATIVKLSIVKTGDRSVIYYTSGLMTIAHWGILSTKYPTLTNLWDSQPPSPATPSSSPVGDFMNQCIQSINMRETASTYNISPDHRKVTFSLAIDNYQNCRPDELMFDLLIGYIGKPGFERKSGILSTINLSNIEVDYDFDTYRYVPMMVAIYTRDFISWASPTYYPVGLPPIS